MDEKPMPIPEMSVAATTAPSPGWYPDPQASGRLRWWDGHGWTEHLTEPPRQELESAVEAHPGFVLDVLDADIVTDDPIEFSWGDIEIYVAEPEAVIEPEPAEGPDPLAVEEPSGFAFRARPLEGQPEIAPAKPAPSIAYGSPLHTIASPLPAAPAPVVQTQPEPEAAPAVASVVVKPLRSAIPRRAMTGSVGLVVLAAAAAGVTNVLRDEPEGKLPPATVAISPGDKRCLKEWNTTASAGAADLRVTLGQFTGAYAQVGRVTPLAGTLMAPDSCALLVHDPATDTDAVFVSGVKDQIGYLDVTAYPRALKQYGTPKSAKAANVAIRADGSIATG